MFSEPRVVESLPEAIAGAREVMSDSGGVKAGINPAKQDLKVGPDYIANRLTFSGEDLISCRFPNQVRVGSFEFRVSSFEVGRLACGSVSQQKERGVMVVAVGFVACWAPLNSKPETPKELEIRTPNPKLETRHY